MNLHIERTEMSENTNTEYPIRKAEHPWLYKCAVKSCGWEKSEPNNEGALDVQLFGGYGDFIDPYDEEPPYFTLCHKHAHKFANWLNNPEILHPTNGHSHSGAENGFWYGHIGWDQKTWTSYVAGFFYKLTKQGFRSAVSYVKHHFKSHKQWTRKDINDSDSPVVLSKFFYELFFLDNAYKGFVTKQIRKYKAARFQRAENAYRSNLTFESELFKKVANNKLTDRELKLIQAIAAGLEEE